MIAIFTDDAAILSTHNELAADNLQQHYNIFGELDKTMEIHPKHKK